MNPIESKDLEHNIIDKVKKINNLRMEITNFTRAKEIREEIDQRKDHISHIKYKLTKLEKFRSSFVDDPSILSIKVANMTEEEEFIVNIADIVKCEMSELSEIEEEINELENEFKNL